MVNQRSRRYRLISLLLSILLLLESTAVMAGPSLRAPARPASAAARTRPAPSLAEQTRPAFDPPPLPSAQASQAGVAANDLPVLPAVSPPPLTNLLVGPPQPASAPPLQRQASAPLAASLALARGWNLLSIPRRPADPSPAAVLASIAGKYDRVYSYNACDSADPWKLYDPANPAASDLTAIDHTIGLWVHATASADLALTGSLPPTTTIALCTGWNLIGLPLGQARPLRNALAPIEGKYSRVFGFDPADTTDPWEIYDVAAPDWANDLGTLRPGRGYWVLASANTSLRLANAGAPPVVAISAPRPSEVTPLTFLTDVAGTVRSDLLQSWTLSYRFSDETIRVPFASGVTPVLTDTLGHFDPTLLLNGIYTIELSATDYAGQTASASVDVVVEGGAKVGNFTLSFVDLEVPVAGLPIQVIRSYDSRDKRKGDFGVGWRLSFTDVRLQENGSQGVGWQGSIIPGPISSYCIQPTRDHVVTISLPDGKVYKFRATVAPQCQGIVQQQVVNVTYTPLPGTNATLTELSYPDPALVDGNFPGPLQLLDQTNRNLYDPNRYRLTLQDGRAFVIDQQAGLQSVTDLNGNTLTFTPNGITHSAGKSVSFTRDAMGRITRIADPQGYPITYAYDAAGDLVGVTDREGNSTSFTYDSTHYLLEITDPRGVQAIRNEYDDSGRLLRHIDASGQVISYTHDLDARQELITDRLGQARLLEYDLRGNVVGETDPLGNVTHRTFDARDNLLSMTDPLTHTTNYTYDAQNNLLSMTDPLSNTTHYTYNSRGQVLTMTDPQGRVITNTYDLAGNLATTRDALGSRTRYSYDARGNMLTQTDPLSNTTRFAYDAFGNLTRQTDPLGHTTSYTYDASGNRLTQTLTRTAEIAVEALTTSNAYDRQGRLIRTTQADGTTTQTEYDELGRQIAATDPLTRTTSYIYDDLGRLTHTLYPDSTFEESSYDAEGRRLTTTDRGGRTTGYLYDALGRLVRTTFPDGAFTTNTYDAAGRLIAATDALSHTTRYGYDAASRRTVVTDTLGLTTTLAYDEVGNQLALKDARGNTTQYRYDALNRRTRTIFADGSEQQTLYDALGRRVAEIDQAGIRTQFAYDALGRLIGVTDALSQTTSYAYDEVGNRVGQTDANGHTTTFAYDRLGRQTKRMLPLGAAETMEYDAAGNLLRHIDFNGAVIDYTYDPLTDRLLRRSYPDGPSVAFTYTPSGQRETATDTRGTTTYRYDLRDRLTSLAEPDGRRLDYGYDAQGNRTSLTAVIGTTTLTTTYAYDAANRLATVTDAAGRHYVHEYDRNGNRARLTYPNGTVTSYDYDKLNRLTNLATRRPTSETIQSYAYTLGRAGNRTRIDELGGTSRAYEYDDLYRLTTETISGASAYANSFSYDAVGNRLTQAKTTGTGTTTVNYTYDARDQLLTENATASSWDANGNLTGKSGAGGASYAWDFDNRLRRVTTADGTVVEYEYDADGNRVQTRRTPPSGPAEVTDYLVDTSGALSQVVAETNSAGNLTAYYVRGDDLLAVIRGSQTRFYHADGLGSIRLLTDETGNVTDRYTFSAFGELLAHSGSDPNAYLFAGEALDPNSGFYYNRARWMDPRAGRFVSVDTWKPDINDPPTLHLYTYTRNDPINLLDPSGLQEFTITGVLTSFTLQVTLRIGVGLGSAAIVYYGSSVLRMGVALRSKALAEMATGQLGDEGWLAATREYEVGNAIIQLGGLVLETSVLLAALLELGHVGIEAMTEAIEAAPSLGRLSYPVEDFIPPVSHLIFSGIQELRHLSPELEESTVEVLSRERGTTRAPGEVQRLSRGISELESLTVNVLSLLPGRTR